MAKMRHARLCESQWEEHKNTIQQLYLDEGRTLEGDRGVINHMKTCHNLHASKAQYERRFRKWGFRKNLKRNEWQLIGTEIERRKQAGLESQVYVFGEALSDDKVQKEISRYKVASKEKRSCSNGPLPEGVTIQCPPCEEPPSLGSDALESISPSSVASDPEQCFPSTELATSTAASQSNLDTSCMDITLFSTQPTAPTIDFESDMLYVMPSFDQGETGSIFPGFPADLALPGLSLGIIPFNTTLLYERLQNPLLQELRTLGIQSSKLVSPCVTNKVMSILPRTTQQELLLQTFDIVLFRQIMFLLMNNFAGSDYAAFESLFQQLKQFSISQMKEILNAIPAPYVDALQQSILTIAIKSGAPAIVRILIDRGLDPNRVTCRFTGSSYTPLGLACKFQQLSIVQLLLDADVDVNQKEHYTTYTAMWHLLGFEFDEQFAKREEPSRATCSIFKLLLAAGAKVSWTELENSRFWSSTPLLDIYIKFAKHSTVFEFGYQLHRPLLNATRLSDYERATCAVQVMLGKNFRAESHLGSDIEARCLEALQRASLHGNTLLVEFFLNSGFHPTVKCLCDAVRGNSVGIIWLFIELGANIDCVLTPSRDLSELLRPYAGVLPNDVDQLLLEETVIRYSLTTPFAEAIRWNHMELIEMFKEEGILNTINENSRLTAALIAAAEAGNSDMVQYLLDRAKDSPELLVPALSLSVTLATVGNHESIVEMLMDAGIEPHSSSITAAILVRNKRLVRLFLDAGISVYIPGLLFFAVRWGDLEVIQLLITAGAAMNEIGWRLGFLEIQTLKRDVDLSPLGEAIRRGNLEVIQLLIEKGANINDEVRTDISGIKRLSPLAMAVQCGHEALAFELLKRGADPNDPAALLAASTQSVDLTQAILRNFSQCYPNGKKYFAGRALRQAIHGRDEAVVELLANYTDVNDVEQRREGPDELGRRLGKSLDYLPSPLGEAIATCHVGVIQILLNVGGEPNSTVATQAPSSHRGRWNALSQAIYTGNLPVVRLIYEAGARISCKTELGITRTPLQLAVELGHQEIVRFLLEHGEDVSASPCIWGGGTALQLAAIKGYVGIAELLLQYGANVNEPPCRFQGRTAFEGAAEYGRMDMLLLLYHQGVDIISDGGKQARNAARFAEQSGQLAAKKLVEQLYESTTLAILGVE